MVDLDNSSNIKFHDVEPIVELAESRSLDGLRYQAYLNVGDENKCCCFSHDEKLFAWSVGLGSVKITKFGRYHSDYQTASNGIPALNSVANAQCFLKIDCGKIVCSMEFGIPRYDSNGNIKYLLGTGLQNGRIKVWNPITGEMLYNLSDHTNAINGLSFALTGEPILISCSSDKTLKIWDLADDGNMTLTIPNCSLCVFDCSFSPTDSSLICSVGEKRSANIWKLEDKRHCKLHQLLKGHQNDVSSCSWSPDGALLATSSHDTTVIVWNPYGGMKLLVLGHANPVPASIFAGGSNGAWVNCVAFSPDGSRIATVCEDDKLRIWSVYSDKEEILLANLHKPGLHCTFSPSGSTVAVGMCDGSASMYQIRVKVLSLRKLSRIAIRRVAIPSMIYIRLPSAISKYLNYENI